MRSITRGFVFLSKTQSHSFTTQKRNRREDEATFPAKASMITSCFLENLRRFPDLATPIHQKQNESNSCSALPTSLRRGRNRSSSSCLLRLYLFGERENERAAIAFSTGSGQGEGEKLMPRRLSSSSYTYDFLSCSLPLPDSWSPPPFFFVSACPGSYRQLSQRPFS